MLQNIYSINSQPGCNKNSQTKISFLQNEEECNTPFLPLKSLQIRATESGGMLWLHNGDQCFALFNNFTPKSLDPGAFLMSRFCERTMENIYRLSFDYVCDIN